MDSSEESVNSSTPASSPIRPVDASSPINDASSSPLRNLGSSPFRPDSPAHTTKSRSSSPEVPQDEPSAKRQKYEFYHPLVCIS